MTITIIEAVGLISMDTSIFGKKGKSDPFIQIMALPSTASHNFASLQSLSPSKRKSIMNKKHQKRTILHKTTTKKSTLNPHYDESFSFKLLASHQPTIVLGVYDYDLASASDPMGEATFSLVDGVYGPNTTHEAWLQVMPTSSCPKASGSIKCSVTFGLTPAPMVSEKLRNQFIVCL